PLTWPALPEPLKSSASSRFLGAAASIALRTASMKAFLSKAPGGAADILPTWAPAAWLWTSLAGGTAAPWASATFSAAGRWALVVAAAPCARDCIWAKPGSLSGPAPLGPSAVVSAAPSAPAAPAAPPPWASAAAGPWPLPGRAATLGWAAPAAPGAAPAAPLPAAAAPAEAAPLGEAVVAAGAAPAAPPGAAAPAVAPASVSPAAPLAEAPLGEAAPAVDSAVPGAAPAFGGESPGRVSTVPPT